MKVIRAILYALISLIALFSMFIIICAVRPDITENIKTRLYSNDSEDVSADTGSDSYDDATMDSIGDPPQDTDSNEQGDDAESDEPTGSGVRTDSPADNSVPYGSSARDDAATAGLRSDNTTDYIAPDESDISAPDNVSGKNGYRQIDEDAQQIDDDDVDDIQAQLDFGNLGDGLQFDPVYYPFYNMLDDTGRRVYRQIYANADAVYPAFMPVEYVTAAQLKNIFEAVYNDHPELFWVETAYSCKYIRSGQCVEIVLSFNRMSQDLDAARTAFNEQVNSIVAGAQNLSDDYAKEKYVHDQLLDKISYSARAEMNQSAYSALVNGQTVCAGYARAFQYILQQLGIPCYYCTGYAGESHAWNIVSLSDGFYNVDTTWDDSDGGRYDYFNKTDEDYSSNHLRQELSVYLPPCDGQMYRNLEKGDEPGEEEGEPRSLADTGVTEDRLFADINRYYEDCYNQVVQNGIGQYTFYNAVADIGLAQQLMQYYSNGACWDIYLQNATNAVGGSYCVWYVEAEELQDGQYLLTHEISMVQ